MSTDNFKIFNIEDDLFRISYVNEKGYSEMKQTHFHNNYEVYYLLRGEKLFFVHDKLYKAEKGDMVIVKPNEVHRTSGVQSAYTERILINFKFEFVEKLLKSEGIELLKLENGVSKLRFSMKEQLEIEKILNQIMKEVEAKEYGYTSSIRVLLFLLLIKIYRVSLKGRIEEEEPIGPIEQKVMEIVNYININYSSDIYLNNIAKEFYISESYLSRIFKKITGFHMSEYIQIVRIKEAQKLLREKDFKIIDIAEKVGFMQIAHFNKTFKKITDTTPLKYRKSVNS
jgi:AraC family transcriptional regulator of arabinose operon